MMCFPPLKPMKNAISKVCLYLLHVCVQLVQLDGQRDSCRRGLAGMNRALQTPDIQVQNTWHEPIYAPPCKYHALALQCTCYVGVNSSVSFFVLGENITRRDTWCMKTTELS